MSELKTSMATSKNGIVSIYMSDEQFGITLLVEEQMLFAYSNRLPSMLHALAGQVNRTFNDVYISNDIVDAVDNTEEQT